MAPQKSWRAVPPSAQECSVLSGNDSEHAVAMSFTGIRIPARYKSSQLLEGAQKRRVKVARSANFELGPNKCVVELG